MTLKRSGQEKERYINELFASIAPKYDFLNSVMSLNRHGRWRRFAVEKAGVRQGDLALDVAAGTGDFAIELARVIGKTGAVVATDFCAPMLELAREKINGLGCDNIFFALANAQKLPFPDDTFDCATIGFALRNVADVQETIAEMTRVVKPGGRVISLEINKPRIGLIKPFWRIYFYGLVPVMARIFKTRREPYEYLPESVTHFYTRGQLSEMMRQAGLEKVEVFDLTLGVVCVHLGVKKQHKR